MFPRLIASVLCLSGLFVVFTLAAQEPGKTPPPATQPKNIFNSQDLTAKEKELSVKYDKFVQSLVELKQRLEKSDNPEDKARAELLSKVLERSDDVGVQTRFNNFVEFLKNQKVDTKITDVKDALVQSARLAQDLKDILELLRGDNGIGANKAKQEALKKLIEDLKHIIRDEKIIIAQTTDKNFDPKQVKGNQEENREAIQKVAAKLGGADGKGGDPKNDKSQAKNDKGDGDKGDGKNEGQTDKNAKEGDAKNKGDGTEKTGDAKEGKQGEKAGGQQADAKSGKEGEKQAGASKDGGKEGGKEGGQAKQGGKEGGQAKSGGDPKGGDKQGAAKKDGDPQGQKTAANNPKDNGAKKDDKQGGKEGGQAKGGEPKSGGDPKGAQSKEGGKGGDPKQGEAKESKGGGQGQPKSGGEPKEGGGGSQAKGGPPPKNNDDPQQDAKQKIQEGEKHARQAEDQLEKKNQERAAEEEEKVVENLERAKKKLEDLLRQLREEELERLLEALKSRCEKMLAMQLRVLDATINIARAIDAQPDKKAKRENIQDSLQLSDEEKKIVFEATKAIEMLEQEGSAVAFPEGFHQIREDMRVVDRRLGAVDTGKVTQAIEQDICDSLREMIKALEKAKKDLDDKKNPPMKPKEGKAGPPPDPKLLDKIAELKLIRSMQIRVNSRTELYGKQYEGEQAQQPAIREELRQLGTRQERIWDVTNRLARGGS